MAGAATPLRATFHCLPGSLEMIALQPQDYDDNIRITTDRLMSLFLDNFGLCDGTLPFDSASPLQSPGKVRKTVTDIKHSLSHSGSLDTPPMYIVSIKADEVALEGFFGDRTKPKHLRHLLQSMKDYITYLKRPLCIPTVTPTLWVAAWELLKIQHPDCDIINYPNIPITGFSQNNAGLFPIFNQYFQDLNTTFETCFFTSVQHSLKLLHNSRDSDSSSLEPSVPFSQTPHLRRLNTVITGMFSASKTSDTDSFDMTDLEQSLTDIFSSENLSKKPSIRSDAPETHSTPFNVEQLDTILDRIFSPTSEQQTLYAELKLLIRRSLGESPSWSTFLHTLHRQYTQSFYCINFAKYPIDFLTIRNIVMPTLGHIDSLQTPRSQIAHKLTRILPSSLIHLHKILSR